MEHNFDKMMNNVAADFFDIPKVFENLFNNSNIPLYHDYSI
jgi:hypothetical protein